MVESGLEFPVGKDNVPDLYQVTSPSRPTIRGLATCGSYQAESVFNTHINNISGCMKQGMVVIQPGITESGCEEQALARWTL